MRPEGGGSREKGREGVVKLEDYTSVRIRIVID